MLPKKSSNAKPVSAKPAKQAGQETQAKKKYPFTYKVEFLGVGKSENGDRYLRRRVGDDVALMSVPNLLSNATTEYVRLQRVGVILAEQQDRKELLGRVRMEASKEPTFDVATQPGILGDDFFFPDGPASGRSNNAFYPEEQHADTYRKFKRAGTRQGWNELLELAKGNSRMILGDALACAGPICGAFGYEPPGIQYVGEGGVGKTPLARIISAIYGWDPTPSTRLGFGTSWKMKPGGLEVIAEAHNHTFLYLDEMSKATEQQVEFVMTIAQGQGTARMTELRRRFWCMPILSTSNRSVVKIMQKLGLEFDSAYVDRLMDLPPPRPNCFVEDLHGSANIAAFAARACQLAESNHGWAGRVLATKFVQALRSDRKELKGFLDAARAKYLDASARITSTWRDLVRVHGRFATIYASGCLGIRFGILPFTNEELLNAVMTCERDHVAFIDQELGIGITPGEAPHAGIAPVATAVPAQSPFDRLKRFIDANRKGGFLDLRKPGADVPAARAPKGYVAKYGDRTEYWLTDRCFKAVAGGKTEAHELKRELARRGYLVTEPRGEEGTNYVVKRPVPGLKKRPYFVAIAHKPSASP